MFPGGKEKLEEVRDGGVRVEGCKCKSRRKQVVAHSRLCLT